MPETSDESEALLSPMPPGDPARRRRWKRWAVGVPIALVLVVLGLLQTPVAGWLVRPILSSQTGLTVETGSVRISPWGTVTIRGARFSDPSIPGPAGAILDVGTVRARIDWAHTATGSPGLKSLVLVGPALRISQDADTGVLNAASFKLFSGGSGAPTPRVTIERGTLELGEHRGGDYAELRRWSVRGDVSPPDASGDASFDIAAIPATDAAGSAPTGALRLAGTVGPAGVSATLDGLKLEDWPSEIVPSRMRDLYARLDLRGRLLPTRFVVGKDGRASVRMTLDGVDLNLPFDASYTLDGPGELLRMRRTRGTIEFGTDGLSCDLSGLIDELLYDVSVDYRGLDEQAPFAASLRTRFRMDSGMRARRFLSEHALDTLAMFENPTGDVDATVRFQRARSGAKIEVSGEAEISNARATYHAMPYPFTDLSGRVAFTQDRLELTGIRGRGPTGATLEASGTFDGLGENSDVRLRLRIGGLPIDRALLDSLTPGRRRLVESLFSRSQYETLLADGLVRAPGSAGTGPEFAFGGKADVDLELRRDPSRPSGARWTRHAVVGVDHAGLVPDHFPFPIVAHGIEVTIAEDQIALTGGRYEGLSGGEAFVTASLDQTRRRPGRDPLPVIEITARGIPIDARLLAAIPGYRDPPAPDQPVSLRTILDSLRVSGTVECQASIGPRADGSFGYDVEANMFGASASPVPWSPDGTRPDPGKETIALDGLDGTVYVTENLIVVDLDAELSAPGLPVKPSPVRLLTQLTIPDRHGGLGDVERTGGLLPTESGPPAPGPGIYVDARVDALDLAAPVEHAAGAVAPDLARRLSALRAERQPEGVVALRAELEGFVGGSTELTLGIDRVDSFSFLDGGVRHRIGPSRGRARLAIGTHPSAQFEGFASPVVSGGVPAGELALDGAIPLVLLSGVPESVPDAALRVGVAGGRLDAPLTGRVVRAVAGTDAGDWLRDRGVTGSFDLGVIISPRPSDEPRPIAEGSRYALPGLSTTGSLRPNSLAIDLPEGRVGFDDIGGRITFEGQRGRLDGIRASGAGVSVGVDGDWSISPGAGASLDLTMRLEGERLGPAVRSLLPTPVVGALDRFEVVSPGPVEANDLRVHAERLGTPLATTTVTGSARVTDASAVVGARLSELTGTLGFGVELTPDGASYRVDLHADRLRAGSLRVEDASATILSDASRPGTVLVPEITGRMHGGRLAGSAQSHADGSATRFWVDLHGSDIRAAPVFDDLLLPEGGLEGPPLPGESVVRSAWSVADDYTRGLLDADLSLSGVVGDSTRTAGRGVVRVAGGSVIALPGLINLIEFSNLRAPLGATLDHAEAVFYVDGTTAAFERIGASSSAVEILGYGTMDWLTREMDLRFRSRATNPVPLLSGVYEALRDELITTRVRGRPGAVRFAAESFGGTRRLIRALLGEPDSDQERTISQVESASRRDRARPGAREAPVVRPSEHPERWPGEHPEPRASAEE